MNSYSVNLDEYYATDKAPEIKGELQAWCNSNVCRKPTKTINAHYGTRKFVERHIDWCPECGSALFWVRSNGRFDKRGKNKFSK